MIYDGAGKYYMTYSARNSNTIAAGGKYYGNTYIGLAVSDSPAGPFVQWTGTNADGAEIGLGDPIFDPAKITAVDGVAARRGITRDTVFSIPLSLRTGTSFTCTFRGERIGIMFSPPGTITLTGKRPRRSGASK